MHRLLLPLAVIAALLLPVMPASARTTGPCKPGEGRDLRGKDFTQGAKIPDDLRCADLTGAKLDAADLTQKVMTGAVLRKASLREADLTQARLDYADLTGADLTDADLGQLEAKHATLRNAVLVDVDAGQAQFDHADLTAARLSRAELTQADFTDAKLINTHLDEATMGQVQARNADFSGARLREAKLTQAKLQFASLQDADLTEAEFLQAELRGADLHGALVTGASFLSADDLDLTGTRGTPATLPDGLARPASPAATGSAEVAEDGPLAEPAAQRAGTRSPIGLALVLFSAFGLVITFVAWGVSARRHSRTAASFAFARRRAEENVTQFGEMIDTLDHEMRLHQATQSSDAEWLAALNAYESAKNALLVAQTEPELAQVDAALRHGRAMLGRLRSRMT